MGRQISFCCGEELIRSLCGFAAATGSILFYDMADKIMKTITAPPEPFSVNGWWQMFFYRSDLGEIVNSAFGRIDASKSPVIECSQPIYNHEKKTVLCGRLWYEPRCCEPVGNSARKKNELDIWYQFLVRHLKKHTKYIECPVICGNSVAYIKYYVDEFAESAFKDGYRIRQV